LFDGKSASERDQPSSTQVLRLSSTVATSEVTTQTSRAVANAHLNVPRVRAVDQIAKTRRSM
jgi:hypothetical protein